MSYRAKSKGNYGTQLRRSNLGSLGYHGNRNSNKLDNPTLLSNNAIDSVDSSNYQFVGPEYPMILKGKLSMTRNPWRLELHDFAQLQPAQILTFCDHQPIEIVLCDPQTKNPLRIFKVQKIADKKENSDLEAYQKLSDQTMTMPNQLSSLKSAIQPYGYTLVEVLKK